MKITIEQWRQWERQKQGPPIYKQNRYWLLKSFSQPGVYEVEIDLPPNQKQIKIHNQYLNI